MNGPGEQFFPSAGFTVQEHCRPRGRDNRDLIQHFAQSGALTDDFFEVVFVAYFRFEIDAFFLEAFSGLSLEALGYVVVICVLKMFA